MTRPPNLGISPNRQAPRRSRALNALALSLLGPALFACGHAEAARPGVPLLPDAAAKGGAWHWTAACQFSPHNQNACAPSSPDLGSAQLSGDEWNLGAAAAAAAAGSVGMSLDSPGALTIKGDLSSAPPCTASTCLASSANTWVRGFPSVLYGINQCHAKTSPPQSPHLALPMKVSAIPSDLIGTTSYTSQTSHVTHDIAYDLWLNRSGTKRPCRTQGTVEIMVWTDYDERALLPESLKVGTATVPYSSHGVAQAGKQAWSLYVSNIYQGGKTVPWGGTVWFVLNQADVIDNGTVSVDLSTVLSQVGTLLQDNYGWSGFAKHYWLDTIPFGMEFGPESGTLTGSGPSYFSLKLSSYCLAVGTTISRATC